MPKIIYNGVLRDMTPEEEVEYNKSIEDEKLLEAEREKVKYKEDRSMAFPSIGDQLDYIFHHGIEKWKTDVIQPVKEKYPKPSE